MRASRESNRCGMPYIGPDEPFINPGRAHWESPTLGFHYRSEVLLPAPNDRRTSTEDEILDRELEACLRAGRFNRDPAGQFTTAWSWAEEV